MAATISSSIRDPDKMAFYLEHAKHMGISILPPHINESQEDFSIEQVTEKEKGIRFGLSGIKNVGHIVLSDILEKRPFKDFEDFIASIDHSKINKRIIENMIKAGAFSHFGLNRNQLLKIYEPLLKSDKKKGQMTLFGEEAASVEVPDLKRPTLNQRLSMEKEVLGVYVTGHPLDEYPANKGLDEFDDIRDGYDARIIGIVARLNMIHTRNGDEMAFFEVTNRMGNRVEVVVFPNVYEDARQILAEHRCIYVEGNVDQGKILASRITLVPKLRETDDA
jgi:DNA polymerase-3 subunit alpha